MIIHIIFVFEFEMNSFGMSLQFALMPWNGWVKEGRNANGDNINFNYENCSDGFCAFILEWFEWMMFQFFVLNH